MSDLFAVIGAASFCLIMFVGLACRFDADD